MQQLSQYKEVEQYLLQVPRYTKKNTPQDTVRFYELLGRPGSRQKIIHVAGTNGKGSVCSYLSNLLQECGFTNGMFTSPHLVKMTERIRLDGNCVQEQLFVDAFCRVRESIPKAGYHPTFFEFLFFMAMLIFEESGADYIILETGLGGRLDATNCIKEPEVCVITSIGLDHMEYLGSTVAEIAGEKAGIIKPGCPVVCLSGNEEAFAVIREKAKMHNSAVFAVDDREIRILEKRKKAIDFSYKSRYYDYISLIVSTGALYQTENAALASRAMEILLPKEVLTQERIRQAVGNAFWEGRMEEVLPEFYVDGAHNEDGIRAFMESVHADGWNGRRTLLFAAVEDKRFACMLSELLSGDLFQKAAAAVLETERSAGPEALAAVLGGYGKPGRCYADVEEAFRALREEQEKDERIYAVGSLYLVGQIKALLI